MLATLAEPPLTGKGLIFEPKYDGIRALVHVAPGKPRPGVRIWSRLGNEKTRSSPPSFARSSRWRSRSRRRCYRRRDRRARRRRPAGRIPEAAGAHPSHRRQDVERLDRTQPTALIAFDLLRDGGEDIRGLPLTRAAPARSSGACDAGSRTRCDSASRWPATAATFTRARRREGWEGLIVKEAASPYQSGRRSPAWRKLKLVNEEEFVVAGWTEPRHLRSCFGALLLGVYDDEPAGAAAGVYRPHRHRVRSEGARAGVEAAEARASSPTPRSTNRSRPTSRRTGSGPISSRRSGSPNGPLTTSSGTRCTSGCGTTRTRKRSPKP